MKLMTTLCFLVAASLYSSDVEDDAGAPMHVPLELLMGQKSRCYQVCNNQDETAPHVFEKVLVGYAFRNNSDGECFVHNLTTNSKLLVKMDLRRGLDHMLSMRMVYGEEESVVTTKPKKKGQRGNINIFGPRFEPVCWQPKIGASDLRPDPYGAMYADENGMEITRHFFQSPYEKEGIFVRVCVQYKKLNEVTLSWGTEAYGRSIKNDKSFAPPNVVGEQKIVFSALGAR